MFALSEADRASFGGGLAVPPRSVPRRRKGPETRPLVAVVQLTHPVTRSATVSNCLVARHVRRAGT
jgi:hypothetical protein